MGTSPGGALGVGGSTGYVPVSVVDAGTRGVVLGWRQPTGATAAQAGASAAHHHAAAAAPPPAAPHHHHHALQLADAAEWPPRASLIAVDSAAILPVQVITYHRLIR